MTQGNILRKCIVVTKSERLSVSLNCAELTAKFQRQEKIHIALFCIELQDEPKGRLTKVKGCYK